MFEIDPKFTRILVTGPHRSGTTLVSEIIAKRLGFEAVRECDLATPRFDGDTEPDLSLDAVQSFLEDNDGVVLQGATCFKWLSELQREDLATVYVVRDEKEIIRSQVAYRGRRLDKPSEKRATWDRVKSSLVCPIVVDYEALIAEPEFVEDREGWEPRQTEPGY